MKLLTAIRLSHLVRIALNEAETEKTARDKLEDLLLLLEQLIAREKEPA